MRASDKRRQVGGVRALGSTRTRRGSALEAGGGPTVSYPLSIDKDGRITLPLETFLDLLAGAVDESTGLVVTPGSTRRIKNKLGESLQMIRGRIEARPTASDVAGLGTAALLDAATSGDAAAGEVVVGSDSRLSDDRTPAAHTHTMTEVTDISSAGRALIDDADAAAQRTTLGLGTCATANTINATQHGALSNGALHALADNTSRNGFLRWQDKLRLELIQEGQADPGAPVFDDTSTATLKTDMEAWCNALRDSLLASGMIV